MRTDDPQTSVDETLLIAFLSDRTTPAQEEELLEWIRASEENRRTFAEIRAIWLSTHRDHPEPAAARFARSLNGLNRRIDSLTDPSCAARRPSRLRLRIRPLLRIAAAAAVAAIAVLLATTRRIAPASERYTYYNRDTTALHVEMPDGTNVWLGTGTQLSYDETFGREGRHVRLDGEAYFDVTHDAGLPFVVEAPALRVRVLGTVFNVRSFSGEQTAETTLAEGSVALQDRDGRNLVCLHPGQQAVYDLADEVLEINEVTVGNLLLLRYGVVTMSDATLQTIVRRIEEHYGIRLRLEKSATPDAHYNFSFQQNASPDDVVELLQFVSGYKIEIAHP